MRVLKVKTSSVGIMNLILFAHKLKCPRKNPHEQNESKSGHFLLRLFLSHCQPKFRKKNSRYTEVKAKMPIDKTKFWTQPRYM